ncbi:hypothetical protein, partial [Mycolicibacterium pallens]
MAQRKRRLGVAAFLVGMSLAGPQAVGVANADASETDSPSVAAKNTQTRHARTARSARQAPPAGAVSGGGVKAKVTAVPRSVRPTPVSGVGSSRRVPVGAVVSGVSVGDGGCAGCWG